MIDKTYIIKRPVLTEKSTASMQENTYTFEVDRRASKDEIKAAVEEIYGVKVLGVRTTVHKARQRRYRYGVVDGKKTKKAMVRLPEGQAIELF